MSLFLTVEVAEQAVRYERATFIRAAKDKVVKRAHLAVVVVDPAVPYREMDTIEQEFAFFIEKAVLYVARFGDRKKWKYPYDKIALGKAFLSWRYRLPSRRIQHEDAYLLVRGDTLYGGSVIDEGGLVVACSGVDAEHDEGFAGAVMARCKSFAQHAAEVYRQDHSEDNFYGGKQFNPPHGYDLHIYRGRYDGSLRCPVCDTRDTFPVGEDQRQCDYCNHIGKHTQFLPPQVA